MTLQGSAAWAVFRRDLAVFASYRLALFARLASVFFTLTMFYFVSRLVSVGEFSGPDDYFAFAVVGILTIEIVYSALVFLPMGMRQELVAGTFERLLLSPFGPIGGLLSMAAFPLLFSVFRAAVMALVAVVVFDLPLRGAEAIAVIPVALLAASSFVPFGLMAAALVLVAKQALGASTWVAAGIGLVAGFYFPVTLLPDWIRWTADVQPFTPAVDLIRHLAIGTELADPVWLVLVQLLAFTAVLLPLSLWLMGRAIQLARNKGTIIEY